MINKGMFSSKTDQWETPQDFFEELDREFHFDLDPCADETNHKTPEYFTKEQDGLLQDWSGRRVFCNPPYGRAIAEELERLDQAVAVLIETIVAPFRRPGRRENGKRGGILAALKNTRAAVRRILTRIFRKGGEVH